MTSNNNVRSWIRGVNLGGWLLLERYITPYHFAITSCHLNGDFCFYPGALSAPSISSNDYKECNHQHCTPVISQNLFDTEDYPVDEWHLASAFEDPHIAEQWLNFHFDNFIKKEDLHHLKEAGITHVRVPLPHWILGDIQPGEPWIAGDRWKYFRRMVGWAREIGLEVWPNLHTAPGSQNGFDNSGKQHPVYTCGGWSDDPKHMPQTLVIINQITQRIVDDGLDDVVTGFGLLNEPFVDCNYTQYRSFLDQGLEIVRTNMGDDVGVFVADMFSSPRFADGTWWLGETNTYLDSHFYSVFSSEVRAKSPKEHIWLVCHPDSEQNDITSCCYEDPKEKTIPSTGVQRISTEWSAAFDAMPGDLLRQVMDGIRANGVAPSFYRQLSEPRKEFLRNFVEAQMITYEAENSPMTQGWFFWTVKTEGGAYAEWDYLRGLSEGWIPVVPKPTVSSESVFGTCDEILDRTTNETDIVHPFPWGDEEYWLQYSKLPDVEPHHTIRHWLGSVHLFLLAVLASVLVAFSALRRRSRNTKGEYSAVGDVSML